MWGNPHDDDETGATTIFTTKDSGAKVEHSDGVVRDTQDGKVKYTLMFPKDVPMEDQLIVRVAELYTRGGLKYGDRNWENSRSEDTEEHHAEALFRHFMKFFFNVQDGEDHAAAIVWNVNALDLTRRNLRRSVQENPAAKLDSFKAPRPVTIESTEDDDPWTQYQRAWDAIESPSPEALEWAKRVVEAQEARNEAASEPADEDDTEEEDEADDQRVHTQLIYTDPAGCRAHAIISWREGATIGELADQAAGSDINYNSGKYTIVLHMPGQNSRVLPRSEPAIKYAGMWRWHLQRVDKLAWYDKGTEG